MRIPSQIRTLHTHLLTCCLLVLLPTVTGCTSTPPLVSTSQPARQPTTPATDIAHADSSTSSDSWRYALVIDASSSASALQIYQWRPGSGDRLPQIEPAPFPRPRETEPWEIKVKPGLSAYGARPVEAARSLEPLIDFALEKIGTNPAVLSRASLVLRATAGVRMLPKIQQEAVLSAVRDSFQMLPFGTSSARVITGEEEGIYGWIAVNYILGHLEHGGPFPTVGALDLGGASTQITFVPLDYPQHHGQAVTIGANTYHLYTHSYLGLGQDQAREAINSPACFIHGYPIPAGGIGTGDFETCRHAVRETFAAPCAEQPCSLFGIYQPPLYGEFLAFSVYAYAADFFDFGQRLVPDDITERGTEFCSQDWGSMIAADPSLADNPYVPNYCYAAAHISVLLTDGFGFSAGTERITAPIRVQGSSVGWALGALVFELAGEPN